MAELAYLGYQTNLMVYGPGGYRFSDYLRLGIPLNPLVGLVTILIAPIVCPFDRRHGGLGGQCSTTGNTPGHWPRRHFLTC